MGCDIHAYIEYRERIDTVDQMLSKLRGEHERGFDGTGRMPFDRRYGLFATMAGVRRYADDKIEIFEPKGMPNNISYHVKYDYTLYVVDHATDEEHCVEQSKAEEYVKHKSSSYWRGKTDIITHPDWHTPSWLTLEEFKTAYKRYLDYFKVPVIPPIFKNPSQYRQLSAKDRFEEFQKQLDEFKDIDEPIPKAPEVEAIIAYMTALESNGKETRLVFWFDN